MEHWYVFRVIYCISEIEWHTTCWIMADYILASKPEYCDKFWHSAAVT